MGYRLLITNQDAIPFSPTVAPNNIKEIYALLIFIAGCIFRKDNKNTQSQCRLRVKRRLDPIFDPILHKVPLVNSQGLTLSTAVNIGLSSDILSIDKERSRRSVCLIKPLKWKSNRK